MWFSGNAPCVRKQASAVLHDSSPLMEKYKVVICRIGGSCCAHACCARAKPLDCASDGSNIILAMNGSWSFTAEMRSEPSHNPTAWMVHKCTTCPLSSFVCFSYWISQSLWDGMDLALLIRWEFFQCRCDSLPMDLNIEFGSFVMMEWWIVSNGSDWVFKSFVFLILVVEGFGYCK